MSRSKKSKKRPRNFWRSKCWHDAKASRKQQLQFALWMFIDGPLRSLKNLQI